MIGKLKQHSATSEDAAKLLSAARRNLAETRIKGLSPETRFDLAYKAIMQCGLLAIMGNGYRPSTNEPGHHAALRASRHAPSICTAGTNVALTTLSIMAFGVWLPYSPVASALGFTHLPRLYWPILLLTLLAYMGLTQIIKAWLLRRKWI